MKQISHFIWCLLLVTGIASAQWTEQTSGVTTQLVSVSAPSDNYVWIAGYAGKVLRTTNGGTTWTAVTNPSAADNYNLYAIDSLTALVTASPSATFVYRTSNGGATWTQVFTQPGGFIDAIWMTTPLNGFMYGDPTPANTRWSLWKTTNGGVNWDSTGMYLPGVGEAGWNNALYMQGTAIWFGTNTTHLYYSPTNGVTGSWVSEATTAGGNEYAIWFNTPNSGLCGGTALNQTVNAGLTWSPLTAPGTANVSGITGVGVNYWFTRQTNLIYRTTNNGTTFTTEYTNPTSTAVYNHITMSRAGTKLWAVTSLGGISKSDGLVGVTPISTQIPNSFSLSQNYPNPFNPTTTIRYAIPQAANVTVKIYDMLGNEVMTVVNEHQNAGTYAGSVDASNIASGVYFYTIKAGSFTDTKKMMLVK